MTRICDYEGSKYRSEFWENQNRAYEDLVERIAIQNLLPPQGETILEVGAGFGRLVDLYNDYNKIVLMDYARSQIEEAQRYLGQDDRYVFVVADVYRLPFIDNLFESLVMVRVMHHLTNIPQALQELFRVMANDSTAIIEHANKRHLKAILRWLFGRQSWNPFDLEPHEFVELNIDFHPTWMRHQMVSAGFTIQDIRTVSHYRIPLLKDHMPASMLAKLDGILQPTGRWLQYTPSVFLKASPNSKEGASNSQMLQRLNAVYPKDESSHSLFKCPICSSPLPNHHHTALVCPTCESQWTFTDGIYDFKTPLHSQ